MAHIHYYPDERNKADHKITFKSILYTGKLLDVSSWLSKSAEHTFYEMLYIISGYGEAVINGRLYPFKAGDVMVYNQGVKHAEYADESNSLHFLFMAIDGLSVPGLPPGHLIAPEEVPVFNVGEARYKLERLFFALLDETSHNDAFGSQLSDSYVISILIQVLRIHKETKNRMLTGNGSESERVKEFIDKNYTQNITLEKLAEVVFINRHHLAHLFKKEMGVPPIKYLIIRRMEEAKRLLGEPALSVASVAKMLGYDNPVYFSQIFKKTVGISPKEYQKNL